MNKLGKLFNEYHQEFSALTEETPFDFDRTVGSVRFRFFGSDERKQVAWKQEHPEWGKIYFSCLSSNPVEIWGDLRQVKRGKHKGALVVNNLSMGHEILHAMRVVSSDWTLKNEYDGLLLSPDKYIEI